ncbi:DNA polymerase alpha subunit p180 [Gracilaria domingensis]|nr:DNA polymerase alpha subunit p180 [Gracilaria domingensis]
MRRFTRGLRNSVQSASADPAARNASGTTSTADYEVREEADIYKAVDESTYVAIAAQKRKEARKFIASSSHHDHDYVMKQKFEVKDELSLVQSKRDQHRKRTNSPRFRRVNPAPTKRVATAFFNTFQTSAHKKEEPDNQAESLVLDTSMLDADFDRYLKSAHPTRKKKRAFNQSVGDLLFDAPAQQLDSELMIADLIPFEPEQPVQDQDDEPPPMPASAKPPIQPKEKKISNPPPISLWTIRSMETCLSRSQILLCRNASSITLWIIMFL